MPTRFEMMERSSGPVQPPNPSSEYLLFLANATVGDAPRLRLHIAVGAAVLARTGFCD